MFLGAAFNCVTIMNRVTRYIQSSLQDECGDIAQAPATKLAGYYQPSLTGLKANEIFAFYLMSVTYYAVEVYQ